MGSRFFFIFIIIFLVSGHRVYSQTYSSKTFAYFDDYIITKSDTIFGKIDDRTIQANTVRYTLSSDDRTKKIKASKILELKSRFLFKRIMVDNKSILAKVLTEGPVSLYSIEKKGVNTLSDKEPKDFTPIREVPSKSIFYLKKENQIRRLDRDNFKAILKEFLNPDEKLTDQINSMEFQELEFRLLNMVIGYNFKQEK